MRSLYFFLLNRQAPSAAHRIYIHAARDSISETYAYLRKQPASLPIYSNAMAAIYFWVGRESKPIPPRSGVAAMQADLKAHGGFVVVFNSIPLSLYQVTQAELTHGLVVAIRLSEATLYRAP